MIQTLPSKLSVCPIWGTPARIEPILGDYKTVNSVRAGGVYQITGTVEFILKNANESTKSKLTTWIIEQHQSGTSIPVITEDVLNIVNNRSQLKYSLRIENFFKCLAITDPGIGVYFFVNSDTEDFFIKSSFHKDENRNQHINFLFLYAYIEAKSVFDLDELENFLFHLKDSNFISSGLDTIGSYYFKLSPEGWKKIENANSPTKSSTSAFVAMWFDPEVNSVYETQIKIALEECGYRGKFRIDHVEHTNKIDDAIIAKINEASLVIVDLTCPIIDKVINNKNKKIPAYRGAVYFEAGYAMGLDIPIVWTCRKDNIDHIHFDLRQYNQIGWYEDGGEIFVNEGKDRITLREALWNRITAIKMNRKI